jgi:hypothetical protein
VRRTICCAAILALAVPVAVALGASSFGSGGTTTLSVSAATPFRSTGITLAKNQHATIAAHGLISYGSQNSACAGAQITPNGCSAESICPVGGGCGALVGRIGDGKPFIVGAGRTVDGPGTVWLGINDVPGAFADNSGAFQVAITVGPGDEVAKVLRIDSGRLYVRRGGGDHVSALHVGELINVGDELLTTQDGRAALEFVIGGRVKVGPGAKVTVTGERSVNGGGEEDTTLRFVTSGVKPSRVEIQTNGGVLGGIKG